MAIAEQKLTRRSTTHGSETPYAALPPSGAKTRASVPRARILLELVWGTDRYLDRGTLDVHIRWLREKIEDDPAKPCYILTVRGVGYQFAEDAA